MKMVIFVEWKDRKEDLVFNSYGDLERKYINFFDEVKLTSEEKKSVTFESYRKFLKDLKDLGNSKLKNYKIFKL